MLFNSYVFIGIFLPITLILFYVLAKWMGPKVAKLWLVATSLFYYGWWNPSYLGLIIGSAAFNFILGKFLVKNRSKAVLLGGIGVNLAFLGYFKYANFFIDNINSLLQVDWTLGKIILPLAISFFTFQQIAFLVDTYKGEIKDYSFLDYTLFVTFFPQLIAGPIVHHKEMMPQFEKKETYRFRWENLSIGLTIFAIGLFKKVMIADALSEKVGKVFYAAEAIQPIPIVSSWAGVLAYSLQIYFDFSGYSDMAIGIGAMFGIILPINFNSPYKAGNVIEFWRRWHMTLSRFLRDYVYIPLGGNRRGEPRRLINLMATMVVGGIWHGAGWTFIFWGFLHGTYLVINHTFHSLKRSLEWYQLPNTALGVLLSRVLTFVLIGLAWVFFRSESMAGSLHLISTMMGFGLEVAPGTEVLIQTKFLLWLSLLLAWVWILPNAQELMSSALPRPSLSTPGRLQKALQWSPNKRWAVLVVVLFTLSITSLSKVSEFLYYQF